MTQKCLAPPQYARFDSADRATFDITHARLLAARGDTASARELLREAMAGMERLFATERNARLQGAHAAFTLGEILAPRNICVCYLALADT